MKFLARFMMLFILGLITPLVLLAASGGHEIPSTPVITGAGFANNLAPNIFMLTDEGARSGGTGFQVSLPSGNKYIVSNHHVCELADVAGVMYARRDNGFSQVVHVVERSRKTDLCLLSPVAHAPGLHVASVSRAGQYVLCMGHPHLRPLSLVAGVLLRLEPVTTAEPLESDNKCDMFGERIETYQSVWGFFKSKLCVRTLLSFGTTLIIFPGNSGSPVVDLDGRVVGVVYAGNSETHQGMMVTLQELQDFLVGR